MSWLSPGRDRKVAPPAEKVKEAQDKLARATARAGREVIGDAREHVKTKIKAEKRRVALALVDGCAAYLRDGRDQDALSAMTRALGSVWARKLRTAITPRTVRPTRKRKASDAPIPAMPGGE